MTNTGLKSGIFPATKCKGQVCIAVKMSNSFKEKLPESMGCHMPRICSGTKGFRVMLCCPNELAWVFSWRDDQSLGGKREATAWYNSQSSPGDDGGVTVITAAHAHCEPGSCGGLRQQESKFGRVVSSAAPHQRAVTSLQACSVQQVVSGAVQSSGGTRARLQPLLPLPTL